MHLLGVHKPVNTGIVSGAINAVQQYAWDPTVNKAHQLAVYIGAVKPAPQLSVLDRHWHEIESFLNYVPDLSTILESGSRLANAWKVAVPEAFRIAISAFYVINAAVIPSLVRSFVMTVVNIIPKVRYGGFGGMVESSIKTVYNAGLTAALTGVSATGLRDLFLRLRLPPTILDTVLNNLPGWLGLTLRAHAILEIRELFNGAQASKALHKGLHGRVSTLLSLASPLVRTPKLVNALIQNKEFFKRAAGAPASDEHGLGGRICRVASNYSSWNPVRWMWAGFEAHRIGNALKDRTASYITNQTLGLTANSIAVMSMVVATNVVASSILAIVYSMFYLAQTFHRSMTTAESGKKPSWYHPNRWLGSPIEA